MLRLWGLHIRPALAALVFLAAGCAPDVVKESFTKIETNRSEPQRLVVTNDTGKALTLLAVEEGGTPRLLPASNFTSIAFSVVAISEIEEASEGPWYKPRRAGQFLVIISSDSEQYITMSGPDAILKVKPEDDQAWTFRFALTACPEPGWVGSPVPPADHQFVITDPPLEGVPEATLCPRE